MRTTWAALILLAAVAGAAAQPEGRALFDADGCRSCHSIGGVGGNAGPDLTFVGFRHSPRWLDRWLQDPRAWKKGTQMPQFRLSPDDRAALVEYLSSLKGQAFGARHWTDGRIIFNKAGCVACHSQNGRGGYPNNNVVGGQIPSLTKVAEGYTKTELMNKIRDGVTPTPADPSQPAPMVFMPQWGKVLSDDEISDVADFLISLDKNVASNGGAKQQDSLGF